MEATKNDLCFDGVKLDYQAMLKTAVIAYAHTIDKIASHISVLQSCVGSDYHTANRLRKEAEQLAVAGEMLHTLQEGLTRSNVSVINIPDNTNANSSGK